MSDPVVRGLAVLWLLALLGGLGGHAAAQTITVKSGEHEGFSRLVLTFDAEAAWRFGRTPDGYELRLAGPRRAYDLSSVFDKIRRDRLAAIFADPATGTLRLRVACTCHALAFTLQPGIVVIDIVDGPPVAGSGFETALDGGEAPLPPLTADGARAQVRPRARPGDGRTPPPPAYDWVALHRSGSSPAPGTSAPSPRVPDPRLESMRDAMLLQLGRAASQGILSPMSREMPLPPAAKPPAPAPKPAAPQPTPVAAAEDHVRVRLPGERSEGSLTSAGAACLTDSAVEIGAWAPAEGGFALHLGPLRARTLGEFDRSDEGAVRELTRFYLHFGFGAEARAVIATLSHDRQALAVEEALARVLDGETLPPGHPLDGMEVCEGPVALWALLARRGMRPGDSVDLGAVLRAFSALPPHLRRHLGPDLAESFLRAGDSRTARAIRDALARAPGGYGAALQLVDARLDMETGETARAEDGLRAVVADDGALSVAALLALADSVIGRGGTLDPPTLLALAARDHEYRGTPDGPAIRRALSLAQGAAGDFAAAFSGLSEAPETVRAELWQLLADRGDTGAVLRFVVGTAEPGNSALPPALRLLLAERALDAGFPDSALAWADGLTSDGALLLAARSELALRDGRAALRRLSGLGADGAAAIRAAAHEMLAQYPEAADVWTEAGQRQARARALWRGNDWADAIRDDATLAGAAEGLLHAPALPKADTETGSAPLAQARALLEGSDATRAAVARLLGDPALAVPDAGTHATMTAVP